ncbi:MAG: TadE family protein [Blastocatellia bacterium]
MKIDQTDTNERADTNERGSAIVEAAVTLLGFLIIIFGIFEAGRMISIQQTLTNAAREGARLAVLPEWGGTDILPSDTAIEARVQTFLSASGMNGATATVVVDDVTVNSTVAKRVTVTAPYRVLTISMFSFLQVNLRGRAMMRDETNLQ